METLFWEKMTHDEFYNLAKEKYCVEWDVKDENKENTTAKFTRDGEEVDPYLWILFLKGFEAAAACVASGELVFPKEK